jgi:hypothetical protein
MLFRIQQYLFENTVTLLVFAKAPIDIKLFMRISTYRTLKIFISLELCGTIHVHFPSTSGIRDLRTPVAMPLQPPRMRSGPDRRCAGIRTSRVYPQVISSGIYSLTRREKTQNLGSDILNLGSRKFWKFSKTRSSI